MAQAAPDRPAPSIGSIGALCLVSASHAYSLAAFFSYAGFLAVDMGWAPDIDRSGSVVGILGTCLPAARIPVSVLWGCAMDRFGRRPCLVLTAACLCVGQLLFPFATEWTPAILTRFVLLGMGNGWVTLMAVCCAELGGPSRQAAILGYVIGAGGVINLIGPGIGGYTYALLGSTFPAMLPCFVGALLSATAAGACMLLLPETRPARRAAHKPSQPLPEVEAAPPAETATSEIVAPVETTCAKPAASVAPAEPVSLSTALRTHPLPLLVCLRCVLGFAGFCKITVVPLWAIASAHAGGLALDHYELGLMLSCSAAFGLVYSTMIMARVIGRLGVRRTMLCSATLQALAVMALPCSRRAPFGAIVLLNAVVEMSTTTCFTCTISAVNNVCARYPHQRGAINGVNVTVESMAKALGPTLGGSLYAWAIAQPVPARWPVNASILYFAGFASLLALFTAGATLLPASIDVAATPQVKPEIETTPEIEMTPETKMKPEVQPTSDATSASSQPKKIRWIPGQGGRGRFHRLQSE